MTHEGVRPLQASFSGQIQADGTPFRLVRDVASGRRLSRLRRLPQRKAFEYLDHCLVRHLSTDLEDELSLKMTRLAQAMGIGSFGQAIELDLRRAHHARLT